MSEQLFSIIIPTRQRHDTLKSTIQSVINQTYPEFELVVMDNFSTPETAEVVASFNDKRIKYYRAPERLSMSDNWELGLSHATGEYIFVLGDDDALMPDGLELAAKLIEQYQTDILSWLRYSYGWSNALVPWVRNRLYLGLSQVMEFWDSKEILKQFFKYQIAHEVLPMVYNSFVSRNLIAKVKSIYGRYFMSSTMAMAPDVYSGLVNAYFSDSYLFSFRALSLIGSSGHSIGASVCYSSFNSEPMKGFIQDEKKDVANELHPNLIPSVNQEIGFAHLLLRTKELFFPTDSRFELDIKDVLNGVASNINRDSEKYELTLQEITALAAKYQIPLSSVYIPSKIREETLKAALNPYQGYIKDREGLITTLIVNCEQAGISNVAQAATLAQGILPKIDILKVNNSNIQHKHKKEFNQQNIPKVVIDGIFFQLYNTGIARVWRSLLAEWVETGFANHVVVLDRNNTAPKIDGVWYRTIPAYSYDNTESDRAMLQQVCDEEGASLFISTYYTTPLTTPSVFMAYDMIPEVMKWDLNNPMWREKHYAIQHASSYISISENTATDIVKFFPEIAPESVRVAHCGVQNYFTPATDAEIDTFKTKYGIRQPYFMLVGIGGYKNPELFLKAFKQLPTRSAFDILLTGASSFTDELRNYTAGSTVHFLQLSDAELRLAYSGAIALVYPSKYEGFGLPVLEALACGCPVITCPNASIPEVAGEAALYVDDEDVDAMADALCEVQKPTLRELLISAGLDQAQKFSWSSMADEVSSALIDATLLSLNLKENNLVIFPDWSKDEEELGMQLMEAIHYVASSSDKEQTTLLVDLSNTSEEEANLMLSSVAMNLMMEAELDVADGPELSLVSNLSSIQWQTLLPKIQGRIPLQNDNEEAIANAQAQDLPVVQLTAE